MSWKINAEDIMIGISTRRWVDMLFQIPLKASEIYFRSSVVYSISSGESLCHQDKYVTTAVYKYVFFICLLEEFLTTWYTYLSKSSLSTNNASIGSTALLRTKITVIQ